MKGVFFIMIIGIDHGYGYMKTAHSNFVTGITPFSHEPPFSKGVLKYDGKYYALGHDRMGVKKAKTGDNDYYLLTLGAIAEELKYKGVSTANVIIGAGLPLTRVGAEKDDFRKYLLQNSEVSFEYEKQHYKVKISDARIFPQGYSSIVRDIATLAGDDEVLLVDIGSWTIDTLPISNKTPNLSACRSETNGVIQAMNAINEEVYRMTGEKVSENKIQAIMQNNPAKLPKEYVEIVQAGIHRYATGLMAQLRENYYLATTEIIVTGGGSCVIKNYYDYDPEMTKIITDIHANAKGYEYLVSQQEKRKKNG